MSVAKSEVKAVKSKKKAAPLPAIGNEYQMTERDEAALLAFQERIKGRPAVPRLRVLDADEGKTKVRLEPAAGEYAGDNTARIVAIARLTETFGGVNRLAADGLLNDLVNVFADKRKNLEEDVNQALAMISSIAPRDALEASLAIQMQGVHKMICDIYRRLSVANLTSEQRDNDVALLAKLGRTYAVQMDTLKRYRTGGEQRVIVQHVHVTADKAAVAINPSLTETQGGGRIEMEVQPHERGQAKLSFSPGTKVQSAVKANRKAVPKPRR